METTLLLIFYIFFPALLIFIVEKYPILDKMGTVVIAYAFGLILGNMNIISLEGKQLQQTIALITVPISLPLLLFSSNIKSWLKLAPRTIVATIITIAGLITILVVGNSVFKNKIPEVWKISGMLVSCYTGGFPNMGAIKTALNVDETTYVLVHTYITIISGILILFLISVGQRFFLFFLRPFNDKDVSINKLNVNEDIKYSDIIKRKRIPNLLLAIGISIIIMLVSVVISKLFSEDVSTAVAILLITTFGIAVSLIPKINKIESSYHAGMYLILIFSLDVASMANFSDLNISSIYILYYVIVAIIGTLTLQIILSKIFKIDADTTIIILTTLIFSPPFVPVVASTLKNKQIIISGLTIGIIGFAIGNYMGVSLAWILKSTP